MLKANVPFLRMSLWGFVAFVVSESVLMELGTRWHDNYEYYGKYPLLYFGPAAVAFVLPAILNWRRRMRPDGDRKT